ncbi:MAG TPA: 2-oxoacid:acceptor oxidoreductase subunit alpha [Bacteroidales bacterium]|nr:2-oxoacid:acceptor oxidoreductase subunit alpha [Bacteroidales bacterium]HPT01326.1 2-oxoacid:acceptor oxidoreductase subunit alpha [Bacteroidales bacterium]
MSHHSNVIEKEDIVIKFVGDSGDGMQLSGTLFSDTAALQGLDLATFPDYPAEIRAPQNTTAGVSGFQVHVGTKKIDTTGDQVDILVAMNPASLRSNLKWAHPGATLILDADAFDEASVKKAGYASNPLDDESLSGYNVVKAPVSSLTRAALKPLNLDVKSADRTRNMFALGICYFLFGWKLDSTIDYFKVKFKKKPEMIEANKIVLEAGYIYADNIEALASKYHISKAKMKPGKYRNITGNIATAWGLLAASERSGRPIFLGSYPITPATDILIELAKHKSLGARVFQAEDEIAGICSAIGASYTGSMAITTTSGPGLSLKSEAIGLAVMTELPLVIVDVQRGGPSTGLPTKSEQSDLMQALFGRNGEAPVVVLASSTPADCYFYAYMAAKIAMEHMTPVILLSDGSLGNGSQLFRITKVSDLPPITPPIAEANDATYKPYLRNPETLVRKWALPGTAGLRHRVGGLEKENITGNVSTDPLNHELMVKLREAKVQKVADVLPEQEIIGEKEGDLLVISWGGTRGTTQDAVEAMQAAGKKVSLAHFNYIMPLPKNTRQVLSGFRKIVVCELNAGQFVNYLRMKEPDFSYIQYNKLQSLPFTVAELTAKFNEILEEK